MKNIFSKISPLVTYAGVRYWTASLFPAVTGLTLPLWLDPPGVEFNPKLAMLFILMTLSGHTGFFLVYLVWDSDSTAVFPKKKLLISGIVSLMMAVLTGICINNSMRFGAHVPEYIFTIYGISVLITGILYVLPPFSFHQRLFGETVVCAGLGMLPVIGGFLVEVGDITRSVYLASLPIVAATALWLWITELIKEPESAKAGYKTTAQYFPLKFSRRAVPLTLIIAIYALLILAVLGRSSLPPLSLIGLFSIIFAVTLIKAIWKDFNSMSNMEIARKYAFLIHLFICLSIILAILLPAIGRLM